MKGCTNKRIGTWISFYEFGVLKESEHKVFLDHLIECEYCYDQVYSIEPFSIAFRNHRLAARQANVQVSPAALENSLRVQRGWWRLGPALMIAASLALAICIGVLVFMATGNKTGGGQVAGGEKDPTGTSITGASPWKDMAIPKAAYTTPKEQVVLRSPEESFNRAMEAYQADDFANAVARLEALSEMEPDNASEVKFYFGVSLLIVGRNQDAILPLRQAAQFSIGPRLESSHYYLALAYLKCNYSDQALEELDAVIEMKGQLRSTAIDLKQQILDSKK